MPSLSKNILFFLCLCFARPLLAQDTEIGFTAGTSYYLGELNQKHFNKINPAAGIILRKSYQKRLALSYHLLYTNLSAADSLQDDPLLKNRNLSFRSNIIEFGTTLEINYFDFKLGSERNWASPYLFFGFSIFYFNPQAQHNGQWHNLQPIGTEGQNLNGGKRYNLINFAIPLGAGFKVNVGQKLCFTLYSGFRKTFTDYLDDVGGKYANPAQFKPEDAVFVDRSIVPALSDGTNTGLQRGNTNTRDWYNFTGIMITFKINRKKALCDAYRN